MKIANKLKSYRERFEYTQSYIADQLKVSRVTISNWEKGRTTPDIYNLIKICDFYNISIEVILREEEIKLKKNYENLAYNGPLKIVYGTKLRPKTIYINSTIDMDSGEVTFHINDIDLKKLKDSEK